MRYLEIVPREPLDRVVRCFWFLEGSEAATAGPTEPVLPDGSPELIFNLADPFEVRRDGATPFRQPRAMLVGQIVEPLPLGSSGRIDLVGVRFQPNGAGGLVDDIASLTGRWAGVDQLPARSRLDSLWHALGDSPTPLSRTALLEDALGALARRRQVDPRVDAAVRAIRQTHGRVSISRLGRDLNTSTRSLERTFSDQVGMSPKLLARITRFQRVFAALRDGTDGWAAVAIRCGYYDQSHLVRDFREFAGHSPAAFLAEQPALTRLFIPLSHSDPPRRTQCLAGGTGPDRFSASPSDS